MHFLIIQLYKEYPNHIYSQQSKYTSFHEDLSISTWTEEMKVDNKAPLPGGKQLGEIQMEKFLAPLSHLSGPSARATVEEKSC